MLSLEKSKLMLGNIPDKGFAGHQIVAGFGNIKLAVPTGKVQYEGYQLLISGSGCRDYEYFLRANQETWIDFFKRVEKYDVRRRNYEYRQLQPPIKEVLQ